MFLEVEPGSIGRIGGGRHRVTGRIDVAMVQSLVRKDAVADLVAGYGYVVVDECHHVSARSFERVLSEVRARYVTGRTATPRRREALAALAAIPDGTECLIVATGRYIGEGFDDARLDTLFLTMPISWRGTLVQYAGRLHRLHPGKTEVRLYDYVDRRVPVLNRMYERRLAGYRSIGYDLSGEAVL